jgi:membrane-associated phospholipid phosphatase
MGLESCDAALRPTAHGNGIVSSEGLWRPFPLDVSWWKKVLDAYTYPGSPLVSGAIVVIACTALVRRGRQLSALLWLGAWLAGSCIELIGKRLLTRPSLYWTNGRVRLHVVPFDNSYPSGHRRSVVIAAIIVYVWRRARLPAAVWPHSFLPLVIGAAHTITDVIGGLLLGAPSSSRRMP